MDMAQDSCTKRTTNLVMKTSEFLVHVPELNWGKQNDENTTFNPKVRYFFGATRYLSCLSPRYISDKINGAFHLIVVVLILWKDVLVLP